MTTAGHNKGPSFDVNADAAKDADDLAALLRSSIAGNTVTYADMGVCVGRPVTSQDYALRKALKHLFLEEGITFDAIPTKGYQRRTNEAEFRKAHRNRLGIHRRFKKARDENALVARDKLQRDQKPVHDARTAFFSHGTTASHGNSLRAKTKKAAASAIEPLLAAEKERLQRP